MMNKAAMQLGCRRVCVWFAVALSVGCCFACGSAVSRGAEFYTQGRYIDAAQVFEHTEGQLSSYTQAERARYGLYRGATLLALGYASDARHWLDYGSALAAESLPAHERSALFEALLPLSMSPLPTLVGPLRRPTATSAVKPPNVSPRAPWTARSPSL